jgi:hypothetical protein
MCTKRRKMPKNTDFFQISILIPDTQGKNRRLYLKAETSGGKGEETRFGCVNR